MPGEIAVGHGDILGAVEIGLGDGQVPEALQVQFVRQRLARVRASQRVGSLGFGYVHIVTEDLAPHHQGQHARPVAPFGGAAIHHVLIVGRADIVDGLAVKQHEGIPVNESPDSLADGLGDRRDNRAAVGVRYP